MVNLIDRVISYSSSPWKLKGNVQESESKQIIFYGGKIYAIRFSELRNLGIDYYKKIAFICKLKGLENIGFFSRACSDCKNSVSIREDSENNCKYKQEKEIKFAVTYNAGNDEQATFYAIRSETCAFDDSLVIYLADNGFLEKYRINIDFSFKPITDFERDDKIPDEYLLRNVEKRLPFEVNSGKGLLGVLKTIFRYRKIKL